MGRNYRRNIERKTFSYVLMVGLVVLAVFAAYTGINEMKRMMNKEYSPEVKYKKDKELAKKDWSDCVVCLDPGHGGSDPGTSSEDRNEKDDNLWLSLKVKKVLEDYGAQVVMTRFDDNEISLGGRAVIANENNADLFVSIHRNFYEGKEKVQGIDIYINSQGTEADYKIGNAIAKEFEEINGMEMKSVSPGSTGGSKENFDVIRMTNMTACLIEMGYMSDEEDNENFYNYNDEYAVAIAEGILEYFK